MEAFTPRGESELNKYQDVRALLSQLLCPLSKQIVAPRKIAC